MLCAWFIDKQNIHTEMSEMQQKQPSSDNFSTGDRVDVFVKKHKKKLFDNFMDFAWP